jgi:hypothetical protein
MTIYGFYSIAVVESRTYDPVAVRARTWQHLQNLKARFPAALKRFCIEDNRDRDYNFRMYLPHETWQRVLVALADEQTWEKFKPEVKKNLPDDPYANKLMELWSSLLDLAPAYNIFKGRSASLPSMRNCDARRCGRRVVPNLS